MALLDVNEVSVRFGGLQALSDVTIDVAEGCVTGLIGPNGAGKTTLFNVITGLQPTAGGRVVLGGTDISHVKPHKRARLGMSRTFQRLEAFGSLSARDNVLVAAEMRQGWSRESFDPAQVTDEIIAKTGLSAVAGERVDTLPTGTARRIELARALAAKPRLLLLDEVSSGLNEEETDEMSELLLELAGDGLGILLVEHDMPFVMQTCTTIHVLDFGRIIARGTPEEIQGNATVRAAYLGEEREERTVKAPAVTVDLHASDRPDFPGTLGAEVLDLPEPAIELVDVRAGYGTIEVLHGVDLRVAQGQVYTLLGPNGAGKSTTLKVISGQISPGAGEVRVFGETVNGVPADALARAGLCTIPEGRGIFPNLTVLENLRMVTFTGHPYKDVVERAFARFPRLQERQKQIAGTMSGGEQQMLAMARALATNPPILLLDELSMGLAPLIVEELYEIVGNIAKEGVSILIVEQFAHEVLGVADAAAIMVHGRVEHVGAPAEIAEMLAAAYLGDS